MKCEICDKEFENLKKLSNHIKIHKIKPKEYYDTFIKKENEEICKSYNKIDSCKKYTKFISMIIGYRKFCSHKCRSNNEIIKNEIKKTNIEKYGCEYNFHRYEIKEKIKINKIKNKEIIQEKIKNTNLNRYGIENPFQSKEIKEKIKHISLEKSEEEKKLIKEKRKQTNIKKYGVKTPSQNKEIKEKIKQTNLEKYGNSCSLHGDKVKEKVKQKNIKKYGVENPFQSKEIKEKIKQTNLEKSEEEKELIKEKRKQTNIKKYITRVNKLLEYLDLKLISSYDNCKDTIKVVCLKCNDIFETSYLNLYQNYGKCKNCFPKYKSNTESYLFNYIKSIESLEIIENDRNILNGKELDIYIPSKNTAIEFDGLYWHSEEQRKNKNYHLDKTVECESKNIQLIHIFEDEWLFKQEIVKSRLKQILDLNNNLPKIYARKCKIKEISPKLKNEFLNKYHIQGGDKSNIKLGAFYNDELISVMTFSHGDISRKRLNNDTWELSRFCSNLNYHIIGIASKLLSYFKRNYQWKEIFSYADRRWSIGNVYKKIGFELDSITNPNYWYVKGLKRIHRFNLRKRYDEPKDIPEWVLRQKEGYFRIYDCGHLKFKIRNK